MSRKAYSPWLILIITILFNMASPLTQFKVPPVMPVLMKEFNFSAGAASMLMSIFAFTGMMVGIPAGFIFRHVGIRITGAIVTCSLVGGAVIGAFSNDFTLLLVSRFIEGIGLSLCSILGPPVIAYYFPGEKLTKSMGILSASVPLGLLLAFTLSPLIEKQWNWQAIWLIFACFSLLIGLLYFFTIGSMKMDMHKEKAGNVTESINIRIVFKNKDVWLLSCLFLCFNLIFATYLTWFPSYCHIERGLTLTEADLLTSIMTVLLIFSGPLGGWLCERLGSRKFVYVFPLVVIVAVLTIIPVTATSAFPFVMIALGLVISFIPTAVFSEMTDIIKNHRLQGIAIGIALIGQNAGMLTGPMAFGVMLDKGIGWHNSFLSLIPVGIFGLLSGLLVKGSRIYKGN